MSLDAAVYKNYFFTKQLYLPVIQGFNELDEPVFERKCNLKPNGKMAPAAKEFFRLKRITGFPAPANG
mgnify:CR=1 FL=1